MLWNPSIKDVVRHTEQLLSFLLSLTAAPVAHTLIPPWDPACFSSTGSWTQSVGHAV